MTLEIADLSHWQTGPNGGPIDFVAMKASGIMAVMLKATQGSHWIDPTFVHRYPAALAAGLLVGAYHFADATNPIIQVNHFLTMASGLSVLALDIENNGIGATASVPQAAEMVARLQIATGRLPLVYISRYGPDKLGTGLPNNVLSRCELWLQNYSNDPVPPRGWSDYFWWQYTDSETVPGVKGSCDRSYFNGTPQELMAWW